MRHLLSALLLVLSVHLISAQNPETKNYLQIYSEASQEASLLFRGQEAVKYPYAGAYNGTYFWFSPVFEEGDVFYNGKYYDNLLLNINAHQETLLAKQKDGVVAIELDSELVEWFTIGSDRFVNLKHSGFNVEHNFYQVIYDNQATIYKGVWKTEDVMNTNQSRMSLIEGYNPKLTRSFVPYEEYYWSDGKNMVKLKTRNTLINLYPERKRDVKRIASRTNLSLEKNLDNYYRKIMNYIEEGK